MVGKAGTTSSGDATNRHTSIKERKTSGVKCAGTSTAIALQHGDAHGDNTAGDSVKKDSSFERLNERLLGLVLYTIKARTFATITTSESSSGEEGMHDAPLGALRASVDKAAWPEYLRERAGATHCEESDAIGTVSRPGGSTEPVATVASHPASFQRPPPICTQFLTHSFFRV
jgi:hypothetical protein